jgi:hypothetical protein
MLFVIALIGSIDFADLDLADIAFTDFNLIELDFFLWHLLSLHFLVPTLHLFIKFFLVHNDFL